MSKIPLDYSDRSVCVLGLGYVGLTLATAMADVGFDVIGVEIRDHVLDLLKRGEPHFYEPGLGDRLKKLVSQDRLRLAKHIPENSGARVYIITVGTPLSGEGRARLDMIESVSTEVARHLRDGDMVVMRSTVKLGTTRKIVVPILDAAGVDYDLVFCPERTLEGKALAELRFLPQIVGGHSMRARVRAAQMFNFITPTVVQVSSLETAEMIKLVDNTQRDVQFAYANEVARMCDAVGVSAAEVITAGKLGYPRTNLPMPGPVGGPCLEKDPHILAEGLRELGIEPEIAMAARHINERQPHEIVSHLRRWADQIPGFPAIPNITLAGLAFKGVPATDDLRGTMAKPILTALQAAFPGAVFRGFDAVVAPEEISSFFGITPEPDLGAAFHGANLVVICNNHACFAGMPVEGLAERMARPGFVYDFWNSFDSRDLTMPEGTAYFALGSHGIATLPGVKV